MPPTVEGRVGRNAVPTETSRTQIFSPSPHVSVSSSHNFILERVIFQSAHNPLFRDPGSSSSEGGPGTVRLW